MCYLDICYLEICQFKPSLPIYPALSFLNILLHILKDFYFSTNFIFIFLSSWFTFYLSCLKPFFPSHFQFSPKIHPLQKPFPPTDTHIPDSGHLSNLTIECGVLQAMGDLLHLGEEISHWVSYHPGPPHPSFTLQQPLHASLCLIMLFAIRLMGQISILFIIIKLNLM